MVSCKAKKVNGLRCKNVPGEDGYCNKHRPKDQEIASDGEDDIKEDEIMYQETVTLNVMYEKINALSIRIEQIECRLQSGTATAGVPFKKPRNLTMAGKLKKAKWIFYNENKNNESIFIELKAKLQAAGWVGDKVPWLLKKEYTDAVFDTFDDTNKKVYIDKI